MKFKIFIQSLYLCIGITYAGMFAPAFPNSPPPDEDFKPWLELCKNRIIGAGGQKIAQHGGTSASVSCTFYIKEDGSPGDLVIAGSSGNKEMDLAAIESLNKAAPFPQCNIPPTDRSVLVVFDKNITLHHYQARLKK